MFLFNLVILYFFTRHATFAVTDFAELPPKSLLELLGPIKNRININDPCICIKLIDCPSLYAIIANQPVPNDKLEYLKKQTCSFDGLEPLVCCPNPNEPPSTLLRRRMDRCLASSEENSLPDDNYSKEGKGYYHPYFHPGYFPSRGTFVNHRFPPKSLLPNSGDYFPNEMPEEPRATTESAIVRSKLLPDETCGLSLDQRIVGGKKATLGAYPWIARLGYTRLSSSVYLYRCGGTLINTRFVLTAVHCIDDLPPELKLATVRLGEQDERTDPDCEGNICADTPQDFTPLVIIAHRNYNVPKYRNDIGLIRLDREAVITPYVSPICLPHKFMQSVNYTGLDAIAAGWGTVNIETSASSPILQDVTLKVANLEDCKTVYSSRFQLNIGKAQLCTLGSEDQDTCEGDSGGPLMRFELIGKSYVPRYFLLGIVSFGPKRCGTTDVPAVFTRVSNHLDWILYHIDDDFAVL